MFRRTIVLSLLSFFLLGGFSFAASNDTSMKCFVGWEFDDKSMNSMNGSGSLQCDERNGGNSDDSWFKVQNLRAVLDKSDYITPINIVSDLWYNDTLIKKDLVWIYDYSTPLKLSTMTNVVIDKENNIITINYVQWDSLRDSSWYEINLRKEIIWIDWKLIEKIELNNMDWLSPIIIYEDSQYIKKVFFSDSSKKYIPKLAASVPVYKAIYLQSYSKKTKRVSTKILYSFNPTSPDDLWSIKDIPVRNLNASLLVVNRNYKQFSTKERSLKLSMRELISLMWNAIKKKYI
jgi:hypothetical protein